MGQCCKSSYVVRGYGENDAEQLDKMDTEVKIDEIGRKRLFLLNKLNGIYKPDFRNIIKYDFNPSFESDQNVPVFKFSCPAPAIPSAQYYHCEYCMDEELVKIGLI